MDLQGTSYRVPLTEKVLIVISTEELKLKLKRTGRVHIDKKRASI